MKVKVKVKVLVAAVVLVMFCSSAFAGVVYDKDPESNALRITQTVVAKVTWDQLDQREQALLKALTEIKSTKAECEKAGVTKIAIVEAKEI